MDLATSVLRGKNHLSLLENGFGARDARTLSFVDKSVLRRRLDPSIFLHWNKAYITHLVLVLEFCLWNAER